ncbi:acetyl-CoA carboxylase biotin carboxylase subunit [Clostridium tyrobutyricum]|uniref:acetyl-CoA carboxylase biotin carboxylase subunit n=1 Tax=Clostridium tyrobutyricum TaxID=1519 RepID=UPI00073D7575|nr:acetyl-CoA carboxylase biotin carboxylase subunit [Clostridium tyrobutyricum]MBV4416948.1 acetyl-CoA carboxylase biotin carboxylase subunit [Clostridium tyrobutyricum]MBV4422702.1 acetyl-CoA carboxylase biotin carboxylase subunit [Clostridium tyrobutyricum]MBV4432098.1 acetyl-CoA carboxylase biotin carboxylase subunit [Clostridium tyrobutyricum]MBV4441098.1 acetyl-CoA carboxylase biotin carboxylase subunit [Clostridium tyrobutyricum]MBV4449850.1 acetyl-CoA carboxylase biotin carboxylase sub
MFNKILIANRGEIAVRIIRACREMGIATVAVYSEADKDALHAQMADEAICIGPASPKDSYLNVQNIISATVLSGAQAIHPGFGFLSENSKFAKICKECNITFIGPDPECIDNMGNKSNARDIMIKAGIPIVPGSKGAIENEEDLLKTAAHIGYPVMIKASAGGGGRGIRIVYEEKDIIKNYENAKAEAEASFGDGTIYLEKFIEKPKHVEFQILGDNFGNMVYLGERDCSMQRRNQKVMEEAPSPIMTEELRKIMGETAVKAAKAVSYNNAGTIEFLLDKNKNYYFMEMNTRIQVEHPITEMVTGIDLVKEQIKIAAGEKLSISQQDINIHGHSIECRINAEDVSKNFMPCPGTIKELCIPGGFNVRVDSAVYSGYKIPPFYDSMIAKLIVYGSDRQEAIDRMRRALGEFVIGGVSTNIDFQFDLLNSEEFVKGTYDTKYIEKYMKNLSY